MKYDENTKMFLRVYSPIHVRPLQCSHVAKHMPFFKSFDMFINFEDCQEHL